jgi:hypothetical protein
MFKLRYVTGSVLLLIGMGHMDALFAERERAGWGIMFASKSETPGPG